MNRPQDKPGLYVDEQGKMQAFWGADSQPWLESRAEGAPKGPRPPWDGGSAGARPSRSPEPGVRVVWIPIGLIVSLFLALISGLANGGSRRAEKAFRQGNAYYEAGNFESAIALYDEAIRRKGTFPEAFYNRGLAHAALGEYDRAIADWNQALRLMPGLLRAYVSRGAAYYVQGEMDKAVAEFDEAIERATRYGTPWRGTEAEVEALGLPGHLQGGATEIDLPAVYAYRGSAYLAAGKSAEALSDLDRAIELRPTLALAYYARGLVHLGMGNYELAASDLLMVLELDNDPGVSREAEDLLEKLGIETEAGLSS